MPEVVVPTDEDARKLHEMVSAMVERVLNDKSPDAGLQVQAHIHAGIFMWSLAGVTREQAQKVLGALLDLYVPKSN